MFRPLGMLGNLNNFSLNHPTDLLFIGLYILDEYLESKLNERDRELLTNYSKKLNKAIESNDFSEINEDFIKELENIISNLGEN